jgi:rod shape-determining protein MreC
MLAFIFFIALMGFTSSRTHVLSWPEKFIKDTVSFSQSLFYKPAGSIAGFFEDVRKLRVIYEENKRMKTTIAHYARDKVKLNYLEDQNERLKTQLAFTERQKNANNYKFRFAEVGARSSDPYNNTITINLGSQDGMKVDMAVMTVEGLIGRIISISEFYSNVQLLTDLNAKESITKAVATTVQGNENQSFGMIEGYNEQTGMLEMTKISPTDTLKEGDTIVTSGLGQVFPKGIVIGTVVSRDVGEFGITHVAQIRPAAKFNLLQEVFVIEVPES